MMKDKRPSLWMPLLLALPCLALAAAAALWALPKLGSALTAVLKVAVIP